MVSKPKVMVTGIGVISPLGLNVDSSWQGLISGTSGIDTITSFPLDGLETTIAGEVKDFDPVGYFGPKEARRMDRFVQLGAAATLEAIESSGLVINDSNRNRVSVMIASGIGGIITLSEQIGVMKDRGANRVSPFLVPMMLPDMASGRVSMLVGAKGPCVATVSACSSGADAIGMAMDLIQLGNADVVLTGGSEAAICPIGVAGFNACHALSKRNDEPQRASRPFDSNRDGFVLGEGAGVLVLETEDHARSRNAKVLAELVGYAATADAHHITQPAPQGEGGARAMNRALEQARLQPEDIDYINAHGTSTPMNDKFETMAMKTVFGSHAYKIPISSTKSMTGHLLGASGALEATVCVMAIQQNILPPTINLENTDPDCDLDYTPNTAKQHTVQTTMSNSFGFGGHNSSLIFSANEK